LAARRRDRFDGRGERLRRACGQNDGVTGRGERVRRPEPDTARPTSDQDSLLRGESSHAPNVEKAGSARLSANAKRFSYPAVPGVRGRTLSHISIATMPFSGSPLT